MDDAIRDTLAGLAVALDDPGRLVRGKPDSQLADGPRLHCSRDFEQPESLGSAIRGL